tara:strand:- start:814 stop:1158 length:345 start_codon:yes stop_codon:yes gene_type:complete
MKTEHQEQVDFVNWFRIAFPSILVFAVPNGGFRHPATARKLKAEGVVKGIPDMYVPEWNLWIEMKRLKGGSVSAEQKSMILYLTKYCGHQAIVGKGFDDAKSQVEAFAALKQKW